MTSPGVFDKATRNYAMKFNLYSKEKRKDNFRKACIFGNRPVMPLMTRDKTGTSRDKTGKSRNKTGTIRDKTGTAGTKQGQ